MKNHIVYIAWIALIIALLAWCEAGYFVYRSFSREADRAAALSLLSDTVAQNHREAQIQSAVASTADDRAVLQAFTQVDPVALASLIKASGTSIGDEIDLGNAVPQPRSSKSVLDAFSFTAQAQGSFASLMRVLNILETLPAPASVQDMNLSVVPEMGGPTLWNLQVQIRVFTSSSISS